jgi:hypothetical protein
LEPVPVVDAAQVIFDFHTYGNTADVVRAIEELPRQLPGSASSVSSALSVVSTDLFPRCNERPLAECVVLAMFDEPDRNASSTEQFESVNASYFQLTRIDLKRNQFCFSVTFVCTVNQLYDYQVQFVFTT